MKDISGVAWQKVTWDIKGEECNFLKKEIYGKKRDKRGDGRPLDVIGRCCIQC